MPSESIRFIHASDFHLERPLGDLDLIPEHLRDTLATAPWKAAENVFAAALVENVDFLVLSGDLLSPPAAGPRGMGFLLDHFDQLAEHDIPVLWTTGSVDAADRWPEEIPLPRNVTRFVTGNAQEVPIRRSGQTVALVYGRAGDGRQGLHAPSYRHDPTDLPTIAVGFGQTDPSSLAESKFDYWALGGRHQSERLEGGARVGAIYAGTPQGRCIAEPGAHGYHLIDIDADATARAHFVEADAIRYFQVTLDANDLGGGRDIRSVITQRLQRLQHENGVRQLLISWRLTPGSGETAAAVGDAGELLRWLRKDFGHANPAVWSLGVEVVPPDKFPANWYDEDTILGDFLRAADVHRKSGGRELNLAPVIEEHPGLDPGATQLLGELDPRERASSINRAILLGVDLLRGGKPDLIGSSKAGSR
jgi:DNA repair protein SbcD/Mre11